MLAVNVLARWHHTNSPQQLALTFGWQPTKVVSTPQLDAVQTLPSVAEATYVTNCNVKTTSELYLAAQLPQSCSVKLLFAIIAPAAMHAHKPDLCERRECCHDIRAGHTR